MVLVKPNLLRCSRGRARGLFRQHTGPRLNIIGHLGIVFCMLLTGFPVPFRSGLGYAKPSTRYPSAPKSRRRDDVILPDWGKIASCTSKTSPRQWPLPPLISLTQLTYSKCWSPRYLPVEAAARSWTEGPRWNPRRSLRHTWVRGCIWFPIRALIYSRSWFFSYSRSFNINEYFRAPLQVQHKVYWISLDVNLHVPWFQCIAGRVHDLVYALRINININININILDGSDLATLQSHSFTRVSLKWTLHGA